MRPLMALALFGVLMAADASAQELPRVHKDPWHRLFTTDAAPASTVPAIAPPQRVDVQTSTASASDRTVVCGMTLIAVDPKIDPKIQAKLPDGPTPAIRVMSPTVCR